MPETFGMHLSEDCKCGACCPTLATSLVYFENLFPLANHLIGMQRLNLIAAGHFYDGCPLPNLGYYGGNGFSGIEQAIFMFWESDDEGYLPPEATNQTMTFSRTNFLGLGIDVRMTLAKLDTPAQYPIGSTYAGLNRCWSEWVITEVIWENLDREEISRWFAKSISSTLNADGSGTPTTLYFDNELSTCACKLHHAGGNAAGNLGAIEAAAWITPRCMLKSEAAAAGFTIQIAGLSQGGGACDDLDRTLHAQITPTSLSIAGEYLVEAELRSVPVNQGSTGYDPNDPWYMYYTAAWRAHKILPRPPNNSTFGWNGLAHRLCGAMPPYYELNSPGAIPPDHGSLFADVAIVSNFLPIVGLGGNLRPLFACQDALSDPYEPLDLTWTSQGKSCPNSGFGTIRDCTVTITEQTGGANGNDPCGGIPCP